MRLTLRTLLAYLDDTLDPAEIKQIGQKVAESDAAQELIARIKQVTRRRRLTTPPITGPGAKFEPNDIAAYLDNVMPADQVAELEKTCLESDVHLAEIAACHQILTLVLGEPALVPPTARQRMYALVHGREAIPSRKAPAQRAREATELEGHPDIRNEADETLLLGLPLYQRQGAWMRWLLPVAGVLLLAGLGMALFMALPGRETKKPAEVARHNPEAAKNANEDKKTTGAPKPVVDTKPPEETKPTVDTKPPEETKPAVDKASPEAPPGKPSLERKEVGDFVLGAAPSLLVARPSDKEAWQRIIPEKPRISTDDPLVSLPGYRSEVRLDSKVHLLLWGNLPQLLPIPLLESGVVLHANSKVDLDFKLTRGRALVSNHKDSGPARVWVRFHDEIWDVTLEEPGTKVGLDLFGRYTNDIAYGSGEPPRAELYLLVLEGRASVKVGFHVYPDLRKGGPAQLSWDNKGQGMRPPMPAEPDLEKTWTAPLSGTDRGAAARQALEELSMRFTTKPLSVVLGETLQSPQPADQILAVLSFGAIDALPQLLDSLADENETHGEVRNFAVMALRQWIGRRGENDKILFTTLIDKKKYTPGHATTIMQLLHGFADAQLRQPQIWELLILYLKHEKLAIRQLAYWHLYRMLPEIGKSIPYNPVSDTSKLDRAVKDWQKQIPEGKLPPR